MKSICEMCKVNWPSGPSFYYLFWPIALGDLANFTFRILDFSPKFSILAFKTKAIKVQNKEINTLERFLFMIKVI